MNFELGKYTKEFPQRLKELLKAKKASQRELAEYLGITQQAVSFYCSGKNYPDGDYILKIADFFGVSVEYLLTGYQPEEKAIKDELKLSATAIEKLKAVSSGELHDVYFFVDKLLADDAFYSAMRGAIGIIETNQTIAINLDRNNGERTEEEKLVLSKFLDFGKYEAAKKLTDYFMSFADKLYRYKISE